MCACVCAEEMAQAKNHDQASGVETIIVIYALDHDHHGIEQFLFVPFRKRKHINLK